MQEELNRIAEEKRKKEIALKIMNESLQDKQQRKENEKLKMI